MVGISLSGTNKKQSVSSVVVFFKTTHVILCLFVVLCIVLGYTSMAPDSRYVVGSTLTTSLKNHTVVLVAASLKKEP